jgi:hypothetical protein
MSNDERSSSATVLSLYHSLSPEEQRKVREGILGAGRDAHAGTRKPFVEQLIQEGWVVVDSHWITLEEAATDLLKSRSQVSRDAKAGRLLTNGKPGRHLRIFRPSVALANFREALRLLKKGLRQPEDPDATLQFIFGRCEEGGVEITTERKRRLRKTLRSPGKCHELIRKLISWDEKTCSAVKRYVDVLWDRHRPQ